MSASCIKSISTVEDCLDSTAVREVELVIPLNKELMRRMAKQAKLKYYPHFPRPYFRIEKSQQFVAQGVIGNRTFRVTFLPHRDKDAMEQLWKCLEQSPKAAPSPGECLRPSDHASKP